MAGRNGARRSLEVARHHFIESRGPELFAAGIHRFRNPVRVNHQNIAGMQLRPSFAKIGVRHDAQGQAARGQLFHRAAGMDDQRRIVARVEE